MVRQHNQFTLKEEENIFSSDSVHLRNIIPEEIWKLVAEKVAEGPISNSFENLVNSSLFFRKLLRSQKTVLLFENVFEIVTSTIWYKEGLEGFPVPEVLKCRIVCSKWNAAVDKLIPQKFQHFGNRSENRQLVRVGCAFETILENWFTNSSNRYIENDVQRFLSHFEQTHLAANEPNSCRNPLIWNDLSVLIITPNDTDEEYERYDFYMENISKLLSKYGSHLHKFSVNIDKHTNFEEDTTLQEWFTYMPNIKMLEFESDWFKNVDISEFCPIDYSLPKISNLETLEVRSIPDAVFNQLVHENNQISTLILGWWYPEYSFYTFGLPNLKKLEFDFDSPQIIDSLGSCQVNWPLEQLMITFNENEDDDDVVFVEFYKIFRVIEDKFSITLVSLDLRLFIDKDEAIDALYEECKYGKLYLPNLKKIKLFLSKVKISFDFLMRMRDTLEEISVHVGYKYPVVKIDMNMEVERDTIQFIGFEENMYESNVWTIFKNLMRFKVTIPNKAKAYPERKLHVRGDWIKRQ